MLTVACVYRTFTNARFGSSYDDSWVRKLAAGVARHLTAPHRFVCLSNTTVLGVETIPLVHNWDGWWSKVEMFRPGLFDGPVLSFDLDVMITGNIDALAGPFPNLMMLADVMPGMKNSTCMWWDARDPVYGAIYEAFRIDPPGRAAYHHLFNYKSMGDQGLINDIITEAGRPIDLWQDVLGAGRFAHFSYNQQPNHALLSAPLSPEMSLVYCLGRPKFDTLPYSQYPMVIEHWSESGPGLNLL